MRHWYWRVIRKLNLFPWAYPKLTHNRLITWLYLAETEICFLKDDGKFLKINSLHCLCSRLRQLLRLLIKKDKMKTDKNNSLPESIQTDEGIRLREKMKNKSPHHWIVLHTRKWRHRGARVSHQERRQYRGVTRLYLLFSWAGRGGVRGFSSVGSWKGHDVPLGLSKAAYTARKVPFMNSFSGNCAASVLISTFMCLWAIYILPRLFHIFPCSRTGRPILEKYKSLTDIWV